MYSFKHLIFDCPTMKYTKEMKELLIAGKKSLQMVKQLQGNLKKQHITISLASPDRLQMCISLETLIFQQA